MYLKSIEVHGFKSFANKLVFEFHNGITGIVGPNGSGKSNVADAVRWVLGEQSAKQLRGASMQDVIFSGTEMRKPQSYAYVALTITNEDHKLNVPYEEVQVARRVYRSGESEYLLNGVTCRLRDVQELFFDTGIGKEGYSIIGQGQIDRIVSGKPEERRELFDEAAGIVKFKKRKVMAEKNLEAESQNLLRVQDILAELEKQVGPLERQSEKAKDFLRLKDELKSYEINMFLMDYENFQQEIKEAKTNFENADAELKKEKSSQEAIKNQYKEIDQAVEKFNTRLDENKEKENEDKLLLGKLDNDISLAKQSIESIAQGKEYYKERIGSLEKSIEDTKAEIDKYGEDQKDVLKTLTDMKEKETLAVQREQEYSLQIQSTEKAISEKNEAVYTFMDATSDISNEQQKAQSMMEQNSIKKAELTKRILENKSQVATATEAMEREEAILNQIKEKLQQKRSQKDELSERVTAKRGELADSQQKSQELLRQYHMESSKLASIKNLAERYEGYGQSIRRVMEKKDSMSGIVGVVADIFKVDKKYEIAVETALGGSIQNVVTEDESTAKELIQYLKKNRFGRATFLPLTTVCASQGRVKDEVFHENGVIGNLASLVEKEGRFEGLIEYLLGRFVLVDTIDNAMALAKKYHHSLRIVTLEGDLINPGGSMSGGAYRNSSNLLGRRREMEQLEQSVASIKKKYDQGQSKIEKVEEELQKLIKLVSDKEEELKSCAIEENTANINYQHAVELKEHNELEYHTILQDGKEIENQRNILTETLERIDKELEASKEKSSQNKEEIQTLTTNLEYCREAEKEIQEQLASIRMEISNFQQKNQFITENLSRLETALSDFEEEHFSYVEDNSHSDEQVSDFENSIQEIQSNIEKTKEEIENLTNAIEEDTKKRDELMSTQREFFDKQDAMMEHISTLDKECVRLNSRIEKLDEQLSGQIDYMWNEYETTYIGAKEYRIQEDISYARMKSKVSETKNSIRQLGDVNVNAIEDYKSVSERYETLKSQHDDLVQSEEALQKIIADLDEEMRKQFMEKFSEIQQEFNRVFKELFGGGKGSLELVEDEDVLEAGIRIIAQPPGKKLQNMMQLSGGEKALTAISLLFAIQNLKPSPFCLLDEIEAALDDSNVKRYAKYLHKLTKNTQFIVITHRQGTMSAADVLYGITMQEKGVSTLVSVKLIEDQLDQ